MIEDQEDHRDHEAGLTLKGAQALVDEWIGEFREGYWPPLANLARLIEEVGELAREINHRYGPKKKRDDEPEADLALELRSEEHTSELQSRGHLVCRLLLEKKNT